jgi:hypothetical protein
MSPWKTPREIDEREQRVADGALHREAEPGLVGGLNSMCARRLLDRRRVERGVGGGGARREAGGGGEVEEEEAAPRTSSARL